MALIVLTATKASFVHGKEGKSAWRQAKALILRLPALKCGCFIWEEAAGDVSWFHIDSQCSSGLLFFGLILSVQSLEHLHRFRCLDARCLGLYQLRAKNAVKDQHLNKKSDLLSHSKWGVKDPEYFTWFSELELELIETHMTQKPMALRVEGGARVCPQVRNI
jgi:hypothetical protein